MNEYVNQLKKEPRSIVAIINFICFFFPFIGIVVSGGTVLFGEVIDGGTVSISVNAFEVLSYSFMGIFLYLVPIILLLIPYIKQWKVYAKYLYVTLPIIALIIMFLSGSFVINGEYSIDDIDFNYSVKHLIGFWMCFICNIAVIGITLVKDFKVQSKDDLKASISNIDMDAIGSQVVGIANEVGKNIQKVVKVQCPHCHEMIQVGKNFCPKCGGKMESLIKKDKIIICANCGESIPEGKKFCPECGASIVKSPEKVTCSCCGEIIPEGKKFCSECGTSATIN